MVGVVLGNRIKALEVGRVNGIENMGGLGLPEKGRLEGSPVVCGLGGSPTVGLLAVGAVEGDGWVEWGDWRWDFVFDFFLIIHIYFLIFSLDNLVNMLEVILYTSEKYTC